MPIFFYNEYKTFSNLYFLLLALSQIIPILQVGLFITYIGPIVIVLGLSMIKELWDHFKTIKKDNQVNNELFLKLGKNGEKVEIKSKDIMPGDIILVSKDQRIPVSCFLLVLILLIHYFIEKKKVCN